MEQEVELVKGREYLPRSLTIDYAGMSQTELDEVSMIMGGSNANVIPYSTDQSIGIETGGAIFRWGDQRIHELLRKVTEVSGYAYGAEQVHIFVLSAVETMWFTVVPKTPLDPETIQDDDGNIIPELVRMAMPEENPNNVFYSWDAVGLTDIENNLKRPHDSGLGLGHTPWIDFEHYSLVFHLATAHRDVIDASLTTDASGSLLAPSTNELPSGN